MAIDPRNFLLNTDYEMDKIIYLTEGELAATDYSKTIPHGLGFAPLVFGVCAYNGDFSDSRPLPYSLVNRRNVEMVEVYANDTNIYIYYTGTGGKIYYRIYALEPSNSTADIPPTSTRANTFILNTDYNYCKLHSKGIVSGASIATINHNLGYVPQALAWRERNGIISPIETNGQQDGAIAPYGITVDTNTLRIDFTHQNVDNVHYRIYYDEA